MCDIACGCERELCTLNGYTYTWTLGPIFHVRIMGIDRWNDKQYRSFLACKPAKNLIWCNMRWLYMRTLDEENPVVCLSVSCFFSWLSPQTSNINTEKKKSPCSLFFHFYILTNNQAWWAVQSKKTILPQQAFKDYVKICWMAAPRI